MNTAMPRLRRLGSSIRPQWKLSLSPHFLATLGTRSSAPENARRRRVTTMRDVIRHVSRPNETSYANDDDDVPVDPVDVTVRVLAPLYHVDPVKMALVARSDAETADGEPTYDVLLQYYMAGGVMKTQVDVSRNYLMANIEANMRAARSPVHEGLVRIAAVLTGIESFEAASRAAGIVVQRRTTVARKIALMQELGRTLCAESPGVRFFSTMNPVGRPARKK